MRKHTAGLDPATEIPPAVWELMKSDPDAEDLGLPSEYASPGYFPAELSAGDLSVFAIIIVLFVTNVSVITVAGAEALPYWLLGFLTFLIPSALITGKLIRMFPEQGAFYVWVFKALGPFWSSLLGFFLLWWPPLLIQIA